MNRTRTSQFKRQIAASFGAKVAGYSENAIIQQTLLDRLVPHIITCGQPESLWIDVGCGNGVLENKLVSQQFSGKMLALDMAAASVRYAAAHASGTETVWLCADIDHLPVKKGAVNGVIAASVLQWFRELDPVLAGLHELLADGGYFLFSLFTGRSFYELTHMRDRFALPHPVVCPTGQQLFASLDNNNLHCITHEHFNQTLYFTSALALLRHLSTIGSTSLPAMRMSRGRLQQFCSDYETIFGSEKGIPLTYEATIGICRKGTHRA